ncbi:MAG: hypothetical protein A3F14_02195 [Gammaproteobacteria bacterium RIFCSPHIGHO2_12_FULL_43_28]|nr:MAG: hypothetical protein A3F14_02195 [Gammaproteobacteria bacterium RIFCSPHIGHO2_12_FULL_43_28]
MSDLQVTFYTILLFLLIAVSAFFSCSETAFMALNRYRLRHKARLKKRYAVRIWQLLKRPDRLLGAILIGNTFANILASSIGTILALSIFGDKGVLIAAFLLAIIILIFAEILPKTLAAVYPDAISRWLSYPIQLVLKLLYPAVWLANMVTNGLLTLLRVRVIGRTVEPLSQEELRSVVYDTTGKISRQYQNMLLSILDLSKLSVEDVMVPRHEIVGLDLDEPLEVMQKQLSRIKQNWVPVYRADVNQVIGVLYARDVMQLLLAQQPITKANLHQFLQEPYFVPEGTPLNVQLRYFQQQQHDNVAFVVDEYGEVLGLLTLNDILEEVVGGFTSSLTAGKRIDHQQDGSYLVEGAMTVREFNRVTEWELPLRGPRTINGLIVEQLEALPHAGTCVLIAGCPIEIVQVKENRVRWAKIYPRLEGRGENHFIE